MWLRTALQTITGTNKISVRGIYIIFGPIYPNALADPGRHLADLRDRQRGPREHRRLDGPRAKGKNVALIEIAGTSLPRNGRPAPCRSPVIVEKEADEWLMVSSEAHPSSLTLAWKADSSLDSATYCPWVCIQGVSNTTLGCHSSRKLRTLSPHAYAPANRRCRIPSASWY